MKDWSKIGVKWEMRDNVLKQLLLLPEEVPPHPPRGGHQAGHPDTDRGVARPHSARGT